MINKLRFLVKYESIAVNWIEKGALHPPPFTTCIPNKLAIIGMNAFRFSIFAILSSGNLMRQPKVPGKIDQNPNKNLEANIEDRSLYRWR